MDGSKVSTMKKIWGFFTFSVSLFQSVKLLYVIMYKFCFSFLHTSYCNNIHKITNISGSSAFVMDGVNSVDGIFTWWPWVAVNMTCQSQRKGTVRACVTNNQAAQRNFGVLSCADIWFIIWLTVNESHWKQNQNSCCSNQLSLFLHPP